MNEVTKINLGRQVFTIAADAYSDLRDYLDDIRKEVEDKDVVEEIEIRMAELLAEHGISPEKVVLKKDVEFLKKQLGSPTDFKEDDDKHDNQPATKLAVGKRFFRDTDNAMIAGVAAGLAKYLGLDTLLVRILFVIFLLITFGWGILVYILLWILVPEAKTASDRLQMAGKPVTVESLKEVAQNVDVKSAAKPANASLVGPINRAFSILLKILGVVMAIFGLSIVFSLIASLIYFLMKSSVWANYNIFPVGDTEHALLYLAMSVIALAAIFIILFGVAIFRRKWPIRNWLTGTLAGLLLIGVAVCGSLVASVYPTVRNAYNDNVHTTTRSLKSFNSINITDDNAWDIDFAYSSNYYVTMNYFDNPNLSNVRTSVNNKVLTIDTNQFDWQRDCQILCVPDTYNLNITVYSPNFNQLQNQFQNFNMYAPPAP